MIHLINGYANYQTAIIHENDKGMSDPDLTKDGIWWYKRTYDNVIYVIYMINTKIRQGNGT